MRLPALTPLENELQPAFAAFKILRLGKKSMPPNITIPRPEGHIYFSYSPTSPPNWGIASVAWQEQSQSRIELAQLSLDPCTNLGSPKRSEFTRLALISRQLFD
jgi:hypothetical protein